MNPMVSSNHMIGLEGNTTTDTTSECIITRNEMDDVPGYWPADFHVEYSFYSYDKNCVALILSSEYNPDDWDGNPPTGLEQWDTMTVCLIDEYGMVPPSPDGVHYHTVVQSKYRPVLEALAGKGIAEIGDTVHYGPYDSTGINAIIDTSRIPKHNM